jgi:signal transduction histidine kinase
VTLRCENAALVLVVADRGVGFDPASVASSGHLGLAGMRERAELLGGTFEVVSGLGKGTEVRARWPLWVRASG